MTLKSRIENHIVDDMSRKQVRYLQPVPPNQASGKLADIYQQARHDFQLVPPITLFSPAPDLLAGLWSISRESQIAAGRVSRQHKEAVAAAVSSINACPYCVDAHVGMLHATSGHDVAHAIQTNDYDSLDSQSRNLIDWALATRTPISEKLASPPFSVQETPEIIGTALTFHFINRMVSIFLNETPMPMRGDSRFKPLAVRLFGATAGKSIVNKQVRAGDSLDFLPAAALPDDFAWAKPNPHIAAAFAGFSALMEQAGQETVPEAVREHLWQRLAQWQGENVGLSRQWLQEAITGLPPQHHDIARLVFLAAFAPYQVDANIITAFRTHHPSDTTLLAATCWASYAATRRISQWLINARTSRSLSSNLEGATS